VQLPPIVKARRGRLWDNQPQPPRYTASRQRFVRAASEVRYHRVSRAASNHTQTLITFVYRGPVQLPQPSESELRVVTPEVCGGFGPEDGLIPEYVVAVWAARRLELTRDPGMGLLCDSAVHCTPCFPSAAVPGGDPRDNRA
jgi:hypothetical protein